MYFDTHAHLDQEEFAADCEAAIARARQAGVEAILCVGVSAPSSRAAVRLAEQHAEIYAAVGIQPNSADALNDAQWQQIVALTDHPRVVAVGETGLDRYWDFTPFTLQQEYLARHLQLSRERGLPVVIHCRDAQADLLPMLREAAGKGPLSGVLHAFSGDPSFAAQGVELGLHVSFAGMVTYTNKKFVSLREAAVTIPEDRVLIETDSPYLVPQPLRGKQQRNEPAYLVHTARGLAELRGVPLQRFAAQTTANARQLFRLG